VLHKNVAEAAVVGFPHPIKGEGIYTYVTLRAGVDPSDALLGKLGHFMLLTLTMTLTTRSRNLTYVRMA
jgi:acyl-coenzyme A synthetase/AMP-(fatty) acid ligase